MEASASSVPPVPRREIEVLDVNFAPRARRRLRRHAAAARSTGGALVVDDCVDVEAEPVGEGPEVGPVVDLLACSGRRRPRAPQAPVRHIGLATGGSPASSSTAPAPARQLVRLALAHRSLPVATGLQAFPRAGRRNCSTGPARGGGSGTAPSRSPRRRAPLLRQVQRLAEAPPEPTSLLEVTEDEADAELESAPENEVREDANLYVELVRHGMFPSCCSACHEPFLVGTLRLGYATLGFAGAPEPPPLWIHVPRCVRLANFSVREADTVRFSPFVPAYARDHVLDALAINVLRTEGSLQPPTRAWHYQPATMQRQSLWGTATTAAAASEGSGDQGRRGISAALLDAMPVERLAEDSAEPCVVCWEPLKRGEEARRLPCLHLFHKPCIDRWLSVRAACPLDNLRLEDVLKPPGLGNEAASGNVD